VSRLTAPAAVQDKEARHGVVRKLHEPDRGRRFSRSRAGHRRSGCTRLNHRSFGWFKLGKPGWQHPSNAYHALGELTYLFGGLEQAFQQIIGALRHQLEEGHIKIDAGFEWDGNPAGAVDAASVALERATQAAHHMYRGIADAQSAISGAAYDGPERAEEI
jgi:hypothetical protein